MENETPTPSAAPLPLPTDVPPPAPAEFQMLDPRVIKLWRVHSAIGSAVLLTVITGAVIGFKFAFDLPFYITVPVWLMAVSLRVWTFFWFPQREYQYSGYRLNDKVLETRSGIWFRVIRLLPLTRLQHVDLQRGPLERYFGLASLVLHTAGTQAASITITGLADAEAERLRDHLVAIGGDDAV
jgi:membrane protein YdbS with pleckstrin-like domain